MLLIIAYTKTLFLFGEIRQRDRLLTKIRFFPIVLLTLDWVCNNHSFPEDRCPDSHPLSFIIKRKLKPESTLMRPAQQHHQPP